MGRKVGRPRQEGRERYPSGQVKPEISPSLWARITLDVAKQESDPLLTTRIARLSFHSQLTNEQTAVAFRIRDTYRRYHRPMQLKESPKSPNHVQADGAVGLAEKRNEETKRSAVADNLRDAEAAWRTIDDMLAGLSRNIRQAILDLCVDDLAINSLLLLEMRRFFDHLARKWAHEWRKQKRPIKPAVRLAPMIVEKAQTKPQRDIDVAAFQAVMRKLRPDLNADGISMLTDKFRALRDRELFRAEKVTAR
jgi:hypothetical protein